MNWPTNRINPNQTPNTRGNGNRRPMPRNGNAVPQNKQTAPNRTPINRNNSTGNINNLSNYGTTRPASSLTEGQIIKGEITDLRNNAIVVTLENNTTVTGQIEDNSQLAIGETAAFRISSLSSNGIVLTPIPKKDITLQMSTIQKALEAAELPKNDRNIELVHALMENQLPINKDTILKMLQLTGQHKDSNIETIIFMNKYNLPITSESIAQFERYENQEHHFILEVNRLCDSLPKLFNTLANSNLHANFPSIGSQILNILLHSDNTSFQTNYLNVFQQPALFSSKEAASELLEILDNASLSEDISDTFKESVLSGTASLNNVMNMIEKAMCHSMSIDNQNLKELGIPCKIEITSLGEIKYIQLPPQEMEHIQTENTNSISLLEKEASTLNNGRLQGFLSLFHSKTNENASSKNETGSFSETELLESTDKAFFFKYLTQSVTGNTSQPLLCLDIFDNDVIHDLWKQSSILQQENHALGNFLSLNERYEFYNIIKDFPFHTDLKQSILSGQLKNTHLLHTLKNVLAFSDHEQVKELFQSPTFHNIIKNELLQNFTLTPYDLKNKFKMQHHFDKVYEQLNELETLIEKNITSKNTDLTAQITNHAPGQSEQQLIHQMKSNLDFMKTLNQMFSYLQLPLHLKEQTAHGELYVYTKKKTLKEHPESIKVLLHLDLEHLKSIDMHISLANNRVDSKFYFSDENAEKLIKTNINLLETALSEKGFISHIEILKMEKPINVMTDFIKKDSGNSSVKRYSFDIRA